ncbi:MAG: hypothetical protein LBL23_06845 [Coriobacteriales bacterium]|jgi:hypothetical protein|nr:hypothetical protein [Coriobacteriales bacterium]
MATQLAAQPQLVDFVAVGEARLSGTHVAQDGIAGIHDPAGTGAVDGLTAATNGTTLADSESWPALVPFNADRGLYLSGDARSAAQIALEVVLRIVASVPERNLSIHVFDPRLTATFAQLSPLRQMRPECFPIPETQAAGFRSTLEGLLRSASLCAEKVSVSGAASLSELWADDPLADGVLNIVVVLDYPYALDAQLHSLLKRLSQMGSASGVQLIVQELAGVEAARDVLPEELRTIHQQIHCERGTILITGYDTAIQVAPSPDFTDARVHELIAARQQVSSNPELPVIPLEELIAADIREPWQHLSTDALRASIGRRGRSEMLSFEFRSESPPNASALIGGAVGQGKSNLLMDIVYSLCCAYGPDELELLLLDFKQGVEFKRFDTNSRGENWLPHARILCLESNQGFGLAVLNYVDRELERRSSAFKNVESPDGQLGVSSLKAYREATGRPLPRILLVIDEFHRIFDGERDNTDTAVNLLENIAKQGRTYGVHLILASQTVSGITAMGARKDGIFAQFPVRLSLKNTAAESQAILSMGNKAAAELNFRGEIILNQNTGGDPENSNERGLSAYVDPEVFAGVQAQLWQKGHDKPPLIFNGKAFAQFPGHRLADHVRQDGEDDALEFWLGQSITIATEERDGRILATDAPYRLRLSRNADQGVALIGPDDENMPVVPAVLGSMLRTAATWLRERKVKVIVLSGEGEEPKGSSATLVSRLQKERIEYEFIPRSEARSWLLGPVRTRLSLADPGQASASTQAQLIIALGLQRIVGLDEEFTEGEGFAAPRYSGRSVLQDLASRGAINDLFFIGWWHNLRAAETDMGMKRTALSVYITVMAGLEDLKSLVGARVQRIDGRPRIGVYDRNGSGGLVEVIPYALPADSSDSGNASESREGQ